MSLTLRNLPPEVEKAIKRTAAREGTSKCRATVSLLERAVAGPKQPAAYHDLDHLAGAWSEKDAREFDRYLAKQRTVDKELWQ